MSHALITYDQMKTTLLERQPQWSGVLPPLMTPDRFLNFALLCLAETPKLFECTKTSLLAGIYQSARDGLELGRDCYLVPFRNPKANLVEAVYVRDYKGIVKLLERTKQVTKAFAEVVYEHDVCTIDYGHATKPLTHQIALTNRGLPLGAYGAIVLVGGTWHVHYQDKKDLDRVKAQAPGREQDPWIKHPLEMWRKTALKNVAKYCPLTAAMQTTLDADDQTEEDLKSVTPAQAARNIEEHFGDRGADAPAGAEG